MDIKIKETTIKKKILFIVGSLKENSFKRQFAENASC